jgi:hypothetical protein
MFICLSVYLSGCLSVCLSGCRLLEDIELFIKSFKEIPEVEFRGETLLRQFHTNYQIE